jgi:hypothetical protein
LQTIPGQQLPSFTHFAPKFGHALPGGAHTPPSAQTRPEQQPSPQGSPMKAQSSGGGAHFVPTPLHESPEQHGTFSEQFDPAGVQAAAPVMHWPIW